MDGSFPELDAVIRNYNRRTFWFLVVVIPLAAAVAAALVALAFVSISGAAWTS
jgi:hypothetical protein